MRKFVASLVVAILSVSVSAFPSVAVTTDFISTWKTDNLTAGSSAANQIRLPLVSTGTYNFSVNWGDDTTTEVTSHNDIDATHTYTTSGTYIVTIVGGIYGFAFNNGGDKAKLINVSQWGNLALGPGVGLVSEEGFFSGAANFNSSATDAPDLTRATSLAYAFKNATSFNGPIGNWNVSSITSLGSTFQGATSFNQPLNNWNVANLTSLRATFQGATSFNQPLNNWNVSKVRHFGIAFLNAFEFNQDLSSWNIASGGVTANQITQLDSFLTNTAISPENYGKLLIGWAALTNSVSGVVMRINAAGRNAPNEFGASTRYNELDSAVVVARQALIAQGWVINDQGGTKRLAVGQSTQLNITYVNQGAIAQTFELALLGDRSARNFTIGETDCLNRAIAAGTTCTTQLTFAPLIEGLGEAELRFLPSLSTPKSFSKVDIKHEAHGDCVARGFSGGAGTAASPYLIATTAQFNCINGFSSKYLFLASHFKLTKNLDFKGDPKAFQQIGTREYPDRFSGTLDGDNHSLLGIVNSSNYAALLPAMEDNAVVKNLVLESPKFVSGYDAGAIVANSSRPATIENVHVNGGKITSEYGGMAGGIAGYAANLTISNCSSSASILVANESSGVKVLGGLVGRAGSYSSISKSYSTGSVTYVSGSFDQAVTAGGLVGQFEGTSISDSFSTGAVSVTSTSATLNVGAFVGYISAGTVTRTFAVGAVTSPIANGFSGRYLNSPTVSKSYWNSEASGLTGDASGSQISAAGRTTAQLKTLSNYDTWGNISEGALSESDWTLAPGNYPQLSFVVARAAAVAAAKAAEAAAEAAANPLTATTQQAPVLAPQTILQAKGKRITPNKTSKIEVEGGSGQGAVKFRSLNEGICKVDATGVITGVSQGKCEVEVVKAADSLFAAATTMASVQILTPYEKLRFAPNEIKADEIKSIRGRYLSYLRADLFGQLSVSALSALSKAQIKVITKRQMAALSPQQRMALKR